MECIKKAEDSASDPSNLLLAIVFRDENWLTNYLEGHQSMVRSAFCFMTLVDFVQFNDHRLTIQSSKTTLPSTLLP